MSKRPIDVTEAYTELSSIVHQIQGRDIHGMTMGDIRNSIILYWMRNGFLTRFDPSLGTLRGYLCVGAKNHVRQLWRDRNSPTYGLMSGAVSLNDVAEELVAEESHSTEEEWGRAWKAVMSLPQQEQEVMQLLLVGWTQEDVTELLGMSRRCVRQVKERALWRLRRIVEETRV